MTMPDPEVWLLLTRLGAGLIVALIAFPLAGYAAKAVRRTVRRSERIAALDTTLVSFVAELVRIGLLTGVLLLVLALAGVQSSSIVAVLGAATLAIGLALQATLANVAAGVLIFVFAPFRVGEFVELNGRQGQVRLLSLFTTELVNAQGHLITLANAQIMIHPMTNFSRQGKARVDLDVVLDWNTDVDVAVQVATSALAHIPGMLSEPPAMALITNLSQRGPTLSVQMWADPPLRADLRSNAALAMHRALRAAGIAGAKPE